MSGVVKFGMTPLARSAARAQTTALVVLLTTAPAFAQTACEDAAVLQPEGCARANADVVVTMPVGENTERVGTGPGAGFADLGFSISIDNDTVAGAPAPRDDSRPTDIAAADARVDLRYDGLSARRLLNVSTDDLRAAFQAGEPITFRTSMNYPAYVTRAEVLVIDRTRRGAPVLTRLPVDPNGQVRWAMPADGPRELSYVLRVYDAAGRYDETQALQLTRTDRAFPPHETTGGPIVAAGEGEDRTRLRNIPVRGGTITVFGDAVGQGQAVTVMGEAVPVDPSGAFVISRILPPGDHVVTVDAGGNRLVRDVNIPSQEWFYIGIGDVTFGNRFTDDLAEADPDFEQYYTDGRLAYYVKGQLANGVTVTSSLDTGDGPIDEMFSRLDEKDPRRILDRLDPEDLYPTYGDDSSAFDDTPTSGRFYVKVERDGSSLTWGDFKAGVTGADLLSNTRALYGAELRYVTPGVTADGDPRANVTLYAAQPETLPQRDILRGTGGSVYFLTRQDINGASETITVQTVDPVTGRIVGSQMLTVGVDYDIDYIQGVITLNRPLNSSANGSQLITNSGSAGQYDINLVAQYEYTPTAGSLDGASVGGRIEVRPTDDLTFGITAMQDDSGTGDQTMAGADVRLDLGELSYIEGEVAQTDGPGFGRSISTDGGMTIDTQAATDNPRALAYRLEGQFDLTEMGLGVPGDVGFYYERQDAGFSTLTEDITADQTLIGGTANIALTDRLELGIAAENFDSDDGDAQATGEVSLAYAINPLWTIEGAVGYIDQTTIGQPEETGKNTNIGLRLTYQRSEDWSVYTFGQVTVDSSGGLGDNDRAGVGFDAQLTSKVAVGAEVSGGEQGAGGALELRYAPTADNEIYLGYSLDPTRTGAGYDLVGRDGGTVVWGARYRQSERLSTYYEDNWDLFGDRRSLTRAYGVTYTPDAKWTFSGGVETGEVRDAINGNFDRDAYSFGAAFNDGDAQLARARLEYSTADGMNPEDDRDTWALAGGYEYKVNDDWRFLANLDSLYSVSDQSSFYDGEYVEASIGYAYRPVLNDRFNLLMRYTYLLDLPGVDQVTVDGSTEGDQQKSHVISIDGNYDLSPKLTVGAKYGYRSSQVAARGTDSFDDSTAHLGILRFDWHVVHKWDVLTEARILRTEEIDLTELGALAAIYRQVGNNAKIGLGYEWGRVSDDMTDFDYDGQGVFLNLVASF